MRERTDETARVNASDFLERYAGNEYSQAVVMADLESAAYGMYEEARYHPEDYPDDWLAAVKLIAEADLKVFGEVRA